MFTNYWTCSKFADWLRGTKRPKYATGKGWADWENAARAAHSIRFWLADTFLHWAQKVVMSPATWFNNIRYYCNNRWSAQTHALVAAPEHLKRGQWCDVSSRFLPCMFDTLVDFVEVETAWFNLICDEKAREKFKPPFWALGLLRFKTWRCAKAGIDHLNWAAALINDEHNGVNKKSKFYGTPTPQAESAKEILELYYWYKNVYLTRPDPHEASGWSKYCDETRNRNGGDWLTLLNEDLPPTEEKLKMRLLKKCQQIEDAYDKEDTEMMCRLIKVRRSLWT